jgi:hypothetical protein
MPNTKTPLSRKRLTMTRLASVLLALRTGTGVCHDGGVFVVNSGRSAAPLALYLRPVQICERRADGYVRGSWALDHWSC